jgi:hypothetical protein
MTLVLKRIVWPDGSSRPADFSIMHDGETVGRLHRMNGVGREQWRWAHFWYTRGPNAGLPTRSMKPRRHSGKPATREALAFEWEG